MKKKLLIASSLLLLSLGSAALINSSAKEVVKVSAEETKELYLPVRDTTELSIGDTVIFVSGNRAYGGVGANPVYSYVEEISGVNNDGSKAYFSSTKALKFQVGTTTIDQRSYYTFKGIGDPASESSKVIWEKTAGRYLSYADEIIHQGFRYGFHEDGHYIQTKGDIIFKGSVDEYAGWNVDFDENGFVYLSYSSETNRYGAENVTDPICMKWEGTYVSKGIFGYYFGGSNVRMLRKVDTNPDYFDFYISKNGNKTHYEPGETTILDGLEMVLTYTKDSGWPEYKISYANEPNFFTAGTADYEKQCVTFTWCGYELSYSATVESTLTGEHYYYTMKDFDEIRDLRGTYLLGTNYDTNTKVLDLSSLSTTAGIPQVIELADKYTEICDKSKADGEDIPEITNNVFEIVYDEDGYYVKVGSQYLCRQDSGNTYYRLYLGTRENAFKVVLGLNGTLKTPENDVFVYFTKAGALGIYLNKNNQAGSNEEKMVLFKKEISEEESQEMEVYRRSFFEKTSACKADDTTDLNDIDWGTLASEFSYLSADTQGYLACQTYVHNETNPESISDMIDRYDYIVYKHKLTNFMNRNMDLINDLQDNSGSNYFFNVIANNTVLIIAITSVAIISLTSLFFLKKKRAAR